uniref:DUF148 domain-containing protein n=1 Tax=Parastrongyloides trichosuri TaxID=131310 RepID=A0A0N4ZJY3_PARTI
MKLYCNIFLLSFFFLSTKSQTTITPDDNSLLSGAYNYLKEGANYAYNDIVNKLSNFLTTSNEMFQQGYQNIKQHITESTQSYIDNLLMIDPSNNTSNETLTQQIENSFLNNIGKVI